MEFPTNRLRTFVRSKPTVPGYLQNRTGEAARLIQNLLERHATMKRHHALSMKRVLLRVLLLSCLSNGDVTVDVDRGAFHARHDLIWESIPTYTFTPYTIATSKLDSSAFLGNGMLGALIYREGPDRLAWDIGRADLYDHQSSGSAWFGNNRLPVGAFLMKTKGMIESGTMRIRIFDAELHGKITTTQGTVEFKSFIARDREAIVVETICGGNESVTWTFKGDTAISSRSIADSRGNYQLNPAGFASTGKTGASLWVQPLTAGGEYVTAWRVLGTGQNQAMTANTSFSKSGSNTRDTAEAKVSTAIALGMTSLRAEHQNSWHALMQRHFFSIPDTRMETYYWVQVYKLLSSARSGGPAINLQGPWSVSSGWPCYWWDLNMELLYYPFYPANLTELGKTLTDLLDRNRAQLGANIKNCTDCAALGIISGDALYSNTTASADHLPWNLHTYFMQYRYTMDNAMLRNRLYPLLRSSMNTYLAYLSKENDGHYHMALSFSPDYVIPVQYRLDPSSDRILKDANYKLALIRWESRTLLDISAKLGISDVLKPRWKAILDSLVPYSTDSNGLMIGSGVPLSESHRHYSHLIAFYPLNLLSWDSASHRALIDKSVNYWSSLRSDWHGYSYTGAASMYATMEMGDSAFEKLSRYILSEARVRYTPSTMYQEGDNPVMETPASWARSLQDMLLQSQGGTIRVFPAIPTVWKDATFHTMRAEGAFLVSAIRKNSKTTMVRIHSLAGQPCQVKTDLTRPVTAVSSSGRKLTVTDSSGFLNIDLRQDENVVLYPAGGSTNSTIQAVDYEQGRCNFFGGQFKGFNYTYTPIPNSDVSQVITRSASFEDLATLRQRSAGTDILTVSDEPHTIELLRVDGKFIQRWEGTGRQVYTVPHQSIASAYLVRIRVGAAAYTRTLPGIP